MASKRKTLRNIVAAKGKTPIVCLTAYTAPFAKIVDQQADIILVGDSLGMVLYGMPNTLNVSLDMMIAHGKAVVNSSSSAMIVVDLPFGSYQKSKEQAFESASRVMAETACSAVKLEGGLEMAETISFLTDRGIAVMGHIGLKPQSVNSQGGYYVHGKNQTEYQNILSDARAVEEAGAFSIVLEGIVADLAHEITDSIKIPTIGIGASLSCDGQVLVTEDMAGLMDSTPSFVKTYGNLNKELNNAVESFADDVRNRKFPEKPDFIEEKKIS